MNGAERKAPETVLADWYARARALEDCAQDAQARLLRTVLDEMHASLEDYLTWLTEKDAELQSGKSVTWLRSQFAGWTETDMARWHPTRRRERQYRACIVPRRANILAARADARRAAASESAA